MGILIVLHVLLSGIMGLASGAHDSTPVAASTSADNVDFTGDIDFGDDASAWANDGECDDKRFVGPGMTATTLLDGDIGHDASDCRAAWEAGDLTLFEPVTGELIIDGISFGDDSGDWTNDNQCDDPRFSGDGMASILSDTDRLRDASDCAAAWRAGRIALADGREKAASEGSLIEGGIDFGTDSSPWANDGECDDPRFVGSGMTTTSLLDSDIRADASDCLAAWRAGTISLINEATGPGDARLIGNGDAASAPKPLGPGPKKSIAN